MYHTPSPPPPKKKKKEKEKEEPIKQKKSINDTNTPK